MVQKIKTPEIVFVDTGNEDVLFKKVSPDLAKKWGFDESDEFVVEIVNGETERSKIVREFYGLYNDVMQIQGTQAAADYWSIWEDGLNILDFYESKGGDKKYQQVIQQVKETMIESSEDIKRTERAIENLKKYITETGEDLISEYFQAQYEKDLELGRVELENIPHRQLMRNKDFSFVDKLSASEAKEFLSKLRELNISREEINKVKNFIQQHRDRMIQKEVKKIRAEALDYLNFKNNHPQSRAAAIFLNNEDITQAVVNRNLHSLDYELLRGLYNKAKEFDNLWKEINEIDSTIRLEIARRLQYYTVDNFIQTKNIFTKIKFGRYEEISFEDLRIIIAADKIIKDVLLDYDVDFEQLDEDIWQEEIIVKLYEISNNI